MHPEHHEDPAVPRPEATDTVHPRPEIPTEALLALLADARQRASRASADAAPAHEAEIASIECALAGRGVIVPGTPEPIPELLALPVLVRALREQDERTAMRALQQLAWEDYWLAWRRIRECPHRELRIRCLRQLLYTLDCVPYGEQPARRRQRALAETAAGHPADYEALLDQFLWSVFSAALATPPDGGEA